MKRPQLPPGVYGSVRADVPKVNIVIGLAGVFVAYGGIVSANAFVLAIGLGSLTVMPFGVALQWLMQWRMQRKIRSWPIHIEVETSADGERIAFVTLAGGDVLTMPLPEDYHPESDGGEWFIRQVAPDLAKALYADES
jgi:hypothetical protein